MILILLIFIIFLILIYIYRDQGTVCIRFESGQCVQIPRRDFTTGWFAGKYVQLTNQANLLFYKNQVSVFETHSDIKHYLAKPDKTLAGHTVYTIQQDHLKHC